MYGEQHGKVNSLPVLVVIVGSLLGKSDESNSLVLVSVELGRVEGGLGVSTTTFSVS